MEGTIGVLCLLIMLSAYFSATETAFSSLNRIRVKNMASEGNKKAKLALKLCDKFDELLTTILVGNNIVNILSSSLATALFVEIFPKNGVAISTVVVTAVVLIFGEISPKSMAKESPESFAMFSAPFINILRCVLKPITFLFSLLKRGIKAIFHLKNNDGITEAELLTMVEEAQSEGGIDENEGDLIKSVIEFYDLDVGDILIPRVDVVAIDVESTVDEIEKVFDETRFSRLPVYKETIDNIVGIINHKDFQYMVKERNMPVADIIAQPVYVLESMKISKLLKMLQQKKSHLAMVTDEYGGTVGVVTLEDIIEELVGEIWDEHDVVVEEIEKVSDNCYKVSCNANLDKLAEELGVEIESDSTTVGGWVSEVLERIPEEGDKIEKDNLEVTVIEADERRALKVMIVVKKDKSAQE